MRSFGQAFPFKGFGCASVGDRGPVSIHQAVSIDAADAVCQRRFRRQARWLHGGCSPVLVGAQLQGRAVSSAKVHRLLKESVAIPASTEDDDISLDALMLSGIQHFAFCPGNGR